MREGTGRSSPEERGEAPVELTPDMEKAAPLELVNKKPSADVREALDDILGPSGDVREAMADVFRMQQKREKAEGALTPEAMEMMAKAMDTALAFVESRTDEMRAAEEAERDEPAWAKAMEAAKALHQLTESFETIKWAHYENLKEVRTLPEGVGLGVRADIARDAESAYRVLLGYVTSGYVNAPKGDLTEKFQALGDQVLGFIDHERKQRDRAEHLKAEMVTAKADNLLLDRDTRNEITGVYAAKPAEEATGVMATRVFAKAEVLPEHTVITYIDDFEAVMADTAEKELAEMTRVYSELESVVMSVASLAERTEELSIEDDFPAVVDTASSLHRIAALTASTEREMVRAKWDVGTDVSGESAGQYLLEVEEDAEMIYGALLDIAAGQLEQASDETRGDATAVVQRLAALVENQREVRRTMEDARTRQYEELLAAGE